MFWVIILTQIGYIIKKRGNIKKMEVLEKIEAKEKLFKAKKCQTKQ